MRIEIWNISIFNQIKRLKIKLKWFGVLIQKHLNKKWRTKMRNFSKDLLIKKNEPFKKYGLLDFDNFFVPSKLHINTKKVKEQITTAVFKFIIT